MDVCVGGVLPSARTAAEKIAMEDMTVRVSDMVPVSNPTPAAKPGIAEFIGAPESR